MARATALAAMAGRLNQPMGNGWMEQATAACPPSRSPQCSDRTTAESFYALAMSFTLRDDGLRTHIECEHLGQAHRDPKPGKPHHRELHHLLRPYLSPVAPVTANAIGQDNRIALTWRYLPIAINTITLAANH
jgi:hypothetical protein